MDWRNHRAKPRPWWCCCLSPTPAEAAPRSYTLDQTNAHVGSNMTCWAAGGAGVPCWGTCINNGQQGSKQQERLNGRETCYRDTAGAVPTVSIFRQS